MEKTKFICDTYQEYKWIHNHLIKIKGLRGYSLLSRHKYTDAIQCGKVIVFITEKYVETCTTPCNTCTIKSSCYNYKFNTVKNYQRKYKLCRLMK